MKLKIGKDKDQVDQIEETAAEVSADDETGTEVKKKAEQPADLTKLKKKELLEIMLRQGEEIDELRAQVAELQEQLDDKNFRLSRVGSLAEASLAVTEIFKEADKAAVTYLANLKRLAEEGSKQ